MLLHKATDGLGGVLESRVVLTHPHLGDHRGSGLLHPPSPELVLEVLLEMIADGPLGVRPTGFKRHLMHAGHLGRDLGPAQDETHLGAVTVAYGHVPALFDHVGYVIAGLLGGQVLVLHSNLGLVLDE